MMSIIYAEQRCHTILIARSESDRASFSRLGGPGAICVAAIMSKLGLTHGSF